MTLREITEDMLRLLELAESEELDEDAVADTFEALEGELEAKADSYAVVISALKSDMEQVKAETNRLSARYTLLENNLNYIKEHFKEAMLALGKTKFKTTLYSFSVAGNGGLAPLKITGDVPKKFTKVEISPDNDKIREFLKDNTCDWAEIGERGTHLSIR